MRFAFAAFCATVSATTDPAQVHLAYGGTPGAYTVTWSTDDPTPTSQLVYFSNGHTPTTATGTASKFAPSSNRTQYVHRASMTDLDSSTTFQYKVGSDQTGWSDEFSFTSFPSTTDWVPKMAVFGDFGLANNHSAAYLKAEAAEGTVDIVLHIGDLAYDLNTDEGYRGDEFMQMLQRDIATKIPYMVTPGNHENANNFDAYKQRFTMPHREETRNMFYSFDLGLTHVIMFSSEALFYPGQWTTALEQFKWIEADLAKANQNRDKVPWIITGAHRPIYCDSGDDHDDCLHHVSLMRTAFESTFNQAGVDVEFWAHEHYYERFFPVFEYKFKNTSLDQPYVNPAGPVHIITGSAGCQENHDTFRNNTLPFSALRASDYGYSKVYAANQTHFRLQYVSDDKNGTVVDDVWVVQDHHGPFSKVPLPSNPVADRIAELLLDPLVFTRSDEDNLALLRGGL